MNFAVFIFSIIFVCCYAGCHGYTPLEIYGSLNEEDKGYFLRYYIAKGYLDSLPVDSAMTFDDQFPNDLPIPSDHLELFTQIQLEPKEFPTKLLNLFAKKYNLTTYEAFNAVRRQCHCFPRDQYICLPNGQCIDVGDVGSVCCT